MRAHPAAFVRLAAVLATTGLLACAEPPPAVAPPPPVVTLAGPAVPITVSLDSVTIGDALRETARRTQRALVIDPSAERYASCARISLVTPGLVSEDQVLALLATALEPSGFQLTVQPGGLALRHDGATVPVGCSAGSTTIEVPPPPSAVTSRDAPETATSTRAISDTEWEVTRAWRGSLADDPNGLAMGARMIPQQEGGRTVGIRLYSIRPGSAYAAVGFQNGDTLLTINGLDIASPDRALEAYARLRGTDRYEVVLQRRGLSRTHVIRVVDRLGSSE